MYITVGNVMFNLRNDFFQLVAAMIPSMNVRKGGFRSKQVSED